MKKKRYSTEQSVAILKLADRPQYGETPFELGGLPPAVFASRPVNRGHFEAGPNL